MTASYSLPPLAYGYAALEPHLDARILELHHDKHHRAYVDGANQAIEALRETRQRGDMTRIAPLVHALAFNLSGHVLHSMYWQNLSPEGGGEPDGDLAAAIGRDFGDTGALKTELVHAAQTVMGSGWGALVFEPVSRRLVTVQFHDHQSETIQGAVPLLVLDAWEHAYYLQYGPARAEYLRAIWNVVSWSDVARRLEAAKALDLCLDRTFGDGAAASRAA